MNDINMWDRSSLHESMLNGKHDENYHDFVVDSEVFSKLFYLVDGIYPLLTGSLDPENDPVTELNGSFKIRKEVKKTWNVE
jgi:hypothetical protein